MFVGGSKKVQSQKNTRMKDRLQVLKNEKLAGRYLYAALLLAIVVFIFTLILARNRLAH
jgi:hypothetical protein